MANKTGRNRNFNDTATVTKVTINSVTATTIAAANPDRIYFSVCLEPDTTDVDAFIRLYPASTDNTPQGEVLNRRLLGADNLLRSSWALPPDNIYTGEISAISLSGTFDLNITEY